MKKKSIYGTILLLIATIVWGVAFVAQTSAADSIGAFTFNASRSLLAALLLSVVVAAKRSVYKKQTLKRGEVYDRAAQSRLLKKSLFVGAIAGAALFFAVNFQQFGIEKYPKEASPSGRAGFLTATYVVIVAVYVAIRNKRIHILTVLSCVVCLSGMFLLCLYGEEARIYLGDVLEVLGALCFAVQILLIDGFSDTDGIAFSCGQFWTVTVLSSICAAIFENVRIADLAAAWLPIAYAGVLSSFVGYTFQIIGQKYVKPTVASVIMSLESVFAALAGWIVLEETLSKIEICGCALVFVSVILSQLIPNENGANGKKTKKEKGNK